MILTYEDFLRESLDTAKSLESPKVSLNFADETIEGLRRQLLDDYMPKAKDKESEEAINSCVTTYIHTLDKRLKIDEDIIKKLANLIGKSHEEMSAELDKKTREYYDKEKNVIG
jgi:hypothetical protein